MVILKILQLRMADCAFRRMLHCLIAQTKPLVENDSTVVTEEWLLLGQLDQTMNSIG
jgi:hypothetical protein